MPNLYAFDEKVAVVESLRPVLAKTKGKPVADNLTTDELYEIFTTRVKSNLHVVLCFSSVGDLFRIRLRNKPALINCCTIDGL